MLDHPFSEVQLAQKSYDLIKRDFHLDEEFVIEGDDPMNQLHGFLTKLIGYLLEKDFERLLNSLYRIDVSEDKVKTILNLSAPDEIAADLSSAIIAREKKKVETRAQYSGSDRLFKTGI